MRTRYHRHVVISSPAGSQGIINSLEFTAPYIQIKLVKTNEGHPNVHAHTYKESSRIHKHCQWLID